MNKVLIQFSHADNVRSIPSVMDGLKPGQRKVLYACLKVSLFLLLMLRLLVTVITLSITLAAQSDQGDQSRSAGWVSHV